MKIIKIEFSKNQNINSKRLFKAFLIRKICVLINSKNNYGIKQKDAGEIMGIYLFTKILDYKNAIYLNSKKIKQIKKETICFFFHFKQSNSLHYPYRFHSCFHVTILLFLNDHFMQLNLLHYLYKLCSHFIAFK